MRSNVIAARGFAFAIAVVIGPVASIPAVSGV